MQNPYQAPAETEAADEPLSAPVAEDTYVRSTLGQTARRWFFVCTISAVPSFLSGLMVTNGEFVAMIIGIVIFAIGYTWMDHQTADQAWRRRKIIRRTLRFTYGTRIAISIVLPVGFYLDMICGIVTISLSQTFVGQEFTRIDGGPSPGFAGTLFLTLLQGVVLNVVLAVYGGIILAIHGLVAALRK